MLVILAVGIIMGLIMLCLEVIVTFMAGCCIGCVVVGAILMAIMKPTTNGPKQLIGVCCLIAGVIGGIVALKIHDIIIITYTAL